ncbi:hypothetical protein AC249_AIPGENE15983 [Exaiptasia diaphana]|nr:hypothetical protein AC249_AIPGENE15983 [Exaiptasia diaphana]
MTVTKEAQRRKKELPVEEAMSVIYSYIVLNQFCAFRAPADSTRSKIPRQKNPALRLQDVFIPFTSMCLAGVLHVEYKLYEHVQTKHVETSHDAAMMNTLDKEKPIGFDSDMRTLAIVFHC